MPSRDAHNQTLDELKALLKKRPMTAREIADSLKCCRPTAYQRVRALQERGDAVYEMPATAEGTGPRPVAYGVR